VGRTVLLDTHNVRRSLCGYDGKFSELHRTREIELEESASPPQTSRHIHEKK
jgi:hypothetical protein